MFAFSSVLAWTMKWNLLVHERRPFGLMATVAREGVLAGGWGMDDGSDVYPREATGTA
jgi:hypothetical protein